MRTALIPAAVALIAVAMPVSAQNGSASGYTAATETLVADSYGLMHGGPPTLKEAAARLDALCASKRRADRRRCDAAWRMIERERARLGLAPVRR